MDDKQIIEQIRLRLNEGVEAINSRNFDLESYPWTMRTEDFTASVDGTMPSSRNRARDLATFRTGRKGFITHFKSVVSACPDLTFRISESNVKFNKAGDKVEVYQEIEAREGPLGMKRQIVAVFNLSRDSQSEGWVCDGVEVLVGIDTISGMRAHASWTWNILVDRENPDKREESPWLTVPVIITDIPDSSYTSKTLPIMDAKQTLQHLEMLSHAIVDAVNRRDFDPDSAAWKSISNDFYVDTDGTGLRQGGLCRTSVMSRFGKNQTMAACQHLTSEYPGIRIRLSDVHARLGVTGTWAERYQEIEVQEVPSRVRRQLISIETWQQDCLSKEWFLTRAEILGGIDVVSGMP